MNLTTNGHTFTVHSEAALVALLAYLLIQDADARRAA
jgi:hypothetical protein